MVKLKPVSGDIGHVFGYLSHANGKKLLGHKEILKI